MTSALRCTRTHLLPPWCATPFRGSRDPVWPPQRQIRYYSPSIHNATRSAHGNTTISREKGRVDPGKDSYVVESLSAFAQKRALDVQTFQYPRAAGYDKFTSIGEFVAKFEDLALTPGQEAQGVDSSVLHGRVHSMRTAGNSLLFMDIEEWVADANNLHSNCIVQVVVEKKNIGTSNNNATAENPIKRLAREVKRGDHICVTGRPYVSSSGELSIRAEKLPELLAPCLHDIPISGDSAESDIPHARHVDMLVADDVVNTMVQRSKITTAIGDYLRSAGFLSVQTPILAANAGGAIARPFRTVATEFSDRELALRIAPELWLKRLIVGGLPRVFEIGPSFRNEGLDKTHNPEFTTCEFYATYWTRTDLMLHTQQMFTQINVLLGSAASPAVKSIGLPTDEPWPKIDFVPALNQALGFQLPSFTSDTAREDLLAIFEQRKISLPSKPTLPRLLDKLSSIYLEPACDDPTWIINTPECLSPLAKSFPHPELPEHQVAARAELFINHREIVNCYEEENSPFEQRRKFVDQQRHAQHDNSDNPDEEAHVIDEDYIKALEWGLPPTGGWGCGIDRLVMLFTGKEKIKDVLSFGDLRMVTRSAEKRHTAQ